MIPFFVADRPMSLKILKGLNLKDYPGVKIGIMAHANTSDNFQKAFRDYPCEDLKRCDAIGGRPCPYKTDNQRRQCSYRQLIAERTVKMCDSGVFTKEGAMLSYEELFAAYDRMNVEYGIMIDILHDARATIESALEAKKAYKLYQDKFKLVVVAQGKTEQEYLDCYSKLKYFGFENIAIGGQLRRNQNTVRYLKIASDKLLFNILEKTKEEHSPDWLFALGCLHPSRVEYLNKLNVWADYKGWIFQYKKRNESLNLLINDIQLSQQDTNIKNNLQEIIDNRNSYVQKVNSTSKELHKGKQNLRKYFKKLQHKFQHKQPDLVIKIAKLVSRGILNNLEEKFIVDCFKRAESSEELINKISINIRENYDINKKIKKHEKDLDEINFRLAEEIEKLLINKLDLADEIKKTYEKILELIQKTEQSHRLEQVRINIEEKILTLLTKN